MKTLVIALSILVSSSISFAAVPGQTARAQAGESKCLLQDPRGNEYVFLSVRQTRPTRFGYQGQLRFVSGYLDQVTVESSTACLGNKLCVSARAEQGGVYRLICAR